MDLKGFNKNQKKAVEFIYGACVVVAGAGSGKTRVLTYRIANMIEHGIKPNNIVAVTFTKKASDEMKGRLSNLIGIDAEEVNMGTFHSICLKMLREYWRTIDSKYGDKSISDLIVKESWQKKTVVDIMQPQSNKFPYGINLDWTPQQALAFISFQKNNLVDPDGTFIGYDLGFEEDKARKLYRRYEELKQKEGKVDFDDMLVMCYEMLRDNKGVLNIYKNKFKYILVDEFQDTNLAQYEIIRMLAEEHRNLFVVGDDKQSIYGFRASNVDLILNFKKEWDAELIPLDINYRSTANIVEWANKLIRNNKNQADIPSIAHKPSYRDPVIIKSEDEDEEAEIITEEIEQLMIDGYKPKEFAVLYRTNAQSRALEEAMMKHKLPYVVLGGANFYNRREIKDIIAFLKLSENPKDDEAFKRVVNTPNRFLGKAFLDTLNNYADKFNLSLYEATIKCPACREWRYQRVGEFIRVINHLHQLDCSPADMIDQIRKITDYDSWIVKNDTFENDGEKGEDNDRIDNLNSLMSSAKKFNSVYDFLQYCEEMSTKVPKGEEDSKIKLMTFHRSKGLEFPIVFVAGVSEGLLPHRNSCSEKEIEEERRLCYVGLTRAMKLLYISFSEFYMDRQAGASQFIDELIKKEPLDLPWL